MASLFHGTIVPVTFVAVTIFILSQLELASSKCISEEKVNGCSIPFNSSFPFRTVFEPACDRHDVCYRCGVAYGWSREQCDNGFLNDMKRLCRRRGRRSIQYSMSMLYDKHGYQKRGGMSHANYARHVLNSCKSTAYLYYWAVRSFGYIHYRRPSLKWCNASCVPAAGRPSVRKG